MVAQRAEDPRRVLSGLRAAHPQGAPHWPALLSSPAVSAFGERSLAKGGGALSLGFTSATPVNDEFSSRGSRCFRQTWCCRRVVILLYWWGAHSREECAPPFDPSLMEALCGSSAQ